MELRQFSGLVERLYDAALNPEGWGDIAIDLARAFNSGSCKFQFQDLQRTHASVLCATSNYDARSNADYESYYFAKDPCVTAARKIGVGTPILSHELIAPEVFLNSEVYNDYGRRIGAFYLVGAMLPVGNGAMAGIGIHRPYGSESYDPADREAMGLLVPHLTRALQMYRKLHGLERQGAIGLAALEALAVGVMVVDAAGRLLFSNTVAEKLLQQGQGIIASHGHLRAQAPERNMLLQQTIREAIAGFTGRSQHAGMLVLPRPDALPLSLLVSPAPGHRLGVDVLQATAIIFVNNPDDRITPAEGALTAQFRLTPAEARLTAALLDGEHVDDYALHAGLSPHTVKTQLKAVFAKTGCGRQSDLIRTILANPVLRMCRQG